jgi:hypothetical protein
MRKMLLSIAACSYLFTTVSGQTLVGNCAYIYNWDVYCYYDKGPESYSYLSGMTIGNAMEFFQSTSDPLNCYTTPTVTFQRPAFSKPYSSVTFTQTWADQDNGWEKLFSYYDGTTKFALVDDNGSVLVSDTGSADFQLYNGTTYLVSSFSKSDPGNDSNRIVHRKVWKFRTGVIGTQKAAAKTMANIGPQIANTPAGDLRIDFEKTGSDKLELRIFDLGGRLAFHKVLPPFSGVKSLVVPAANLPRSPYIADIKQGSAEFSKKQIPVH